MSKKKIEEEKQKKELKKSLPANDKVFEEASERMKWFVGKNKMQDGKQRQSIIEDYYTCNLYDKAIDDCCYKEESELLPTEKIGIVLADLTLEAGSSMDWLCIYEHSRYAHDENLDFIIGVYEKYFGNELASSAKLVFEIFAKYPESFDITDEEVETYKKENEILKKYKPTFAKVCAKFAMENDDLYGPLWEVNKLKKDINNRIAYEEKQREELEKELKDTKKENKKLLIWTLVSYAAIAALFIIKYI